MDSIEARLATVQPDSTLSPHLVESERAHRDELPEPVLERPLN